MSRKGRHCVRDPLAGILADWFGVEGGSARILVALDNAPHGLVARELSRLADVAEEAVVGCISRLRKAGVDIPRQSKWATPVYELTDPARKEVRKALQSALELLEQKLGKREDALAAENAELREAIGLTWESPLEWRLTPQETRFVGVLMRTKVAPRQRIMGALYAGSDEYPSDTIVSVMACKIRAKLKPFGLDIRSKHGVGYYLEETKAA